jgi:hypothetical protein
MAGYRTGAGAPDDARELGIMPRGLNDQEQLQEQLARLVDRVGIEGVLRGLAELAHERSELMRTDWANKQSAKRWTAIAGAVGALSKTCAV